MFQQTPNYITTLVFVLGPGAWQGGAAQAPETPLALEPDVPDAPTKERGAPPSRPVRLPEERYGQASIFRVFDRVAYALVMDPSRSVNTMALAQNP